MSTRHGIFGFVQELKRRRVFRVGAGYAVGAWVIVQLSDIVVPALELPEHMVLLVLIAALVGFPIAVLVAWFYDFTPEGVKATAALIEPAAALDARSSSAVASVAVLPFAKLTPATAHAYLADALPMELQSLLSRMPELRVVSRQSALAQSTAGSNLPSIARELSVHYAISGSVTEVGERLQINVQLDDAVEDRLLWSERYDVATGDVDGLLRQISERVVGTFGGERMRTEIRRANEASATATSAGQLVQRAKTYLVDYTPDTIQAAIPLLRKAIELDPKYAIGYATLALVTAEKTLNGISANVAADRSFAIEVGERAERLAPRDPVVLRAIGCVHAYTGHYRRSIALLRQAIKLAPYDLGSWGYLGWPLVATGEAADLAEVQQIMTRLLAMSPEHPGHVYWLYHRSVAHACGDDLEPALAAAEECTSQQPQFSLAWLHCANVLGRLGRAAAARAAVDKSLQHNPMMTPAYYVELMRVLTDRPDVVGRRTGGLTSAGLVGEAVTA